MRFCVVEIRALSESSSLEAVAKVAGAPHTPTLHWKSKISREYKRKGEKHQESTREEEKNIKRVQESTREKKKTARENKPGTILLEMKREQSNLIYHSSFLDALASLDFKLSLSELMNH